MLCSHCSLNILYRYLNPNRSTYIYKKKTMEMFFLWMKMFKKLGFLRTTEKKGKN